VDVKSPQFTLTSDKLTVIFTKMRTGAKKDPTAKPSPTPKADASTPSSPQGGGIDKVIAEEMSWS